MNVVPYERRAWVSLLEPAAELAREVAQTDFVPKALRGNPAAITAAILFGDEVGLSPMQSLARVAVIDGRPTLAAETLRALVLQAGHEIQVEESTAVRCTVTGRRRDSASTATVTWTLEDAKRARLAGRPAWQAYPRQMLFARASAELVRALFPDVVGGFMAAEELDEGHLVEQAPTGGNGPTPSPAEPARRRRRATTSQPQTSSRPLDAVADDPLPPLPGEDEEGPSPLDAAGEGDGAEGEPGPEGSQAPSGSASAGPSGIESGHPDTPEPELLTEPQRRRIFALMRERGFNDRTHRLAWVSRTIGRRIESSSELTIGEASVVVMALEALGLHPEEWAGETEDGMEP